MPKETDPCLIRSMNSQTSFWSERCVWATEQSLITLLSKLYGSYGAVTAAFSLTAIWSACLFIRLRFIPPMTRQSMWGLFGIFTILVFVGSLSGIIAWSFRILIRVEDYTAIKVTDKAEAQAIVAQKYRVQGGWFAFYGLEFFCLSLAKLLVRNIPLSSRFLTNPPSTSLNNPGTRSLLQSQHRVSNSKKTPPLETAQIWRGLLCCCL